MTEMDDRAGLSQSLERGLTILSLSTPDRPTWSTCWTASTSSSAA
jgi:hypothetical protein